MRCSRCLFSATQIFVFGSPHTLTSTASPFIRPLLPHPPPTSAPGSSSHFKPTEGLEVRPSGPKELAEAFQLFPLVYTPSEVRQLLRASLWKLDRIDTVRRRRGRRRTASPTDISGSRGETTSNAQELFEGEYGFEEGHFDSVIHHYRETLISSLAPSDPQWPDLVPLMQRAYDLLPPSPISPGSSTSSRPSSPPPLVCSPSRPTPSGTSTHLLHLAPHGEILPHVDNIQASGSVIIGVSLGAERVLRLERKDETASGGWDIRLPSGSVYLQRDAVRYDYKHSVLPFSHAGSVWDGTRLREGHRISIMIRDAASQAATL